MASTLALCFFAALSLNLVLNFALGAREILRQKQISVLHFSYPWIIVFVSTVFLWIFFARILQFAGGIFEFLLLLPFSAMAGFTLEKVFFYFALQYKDLGANPRLFAAGSPYHELTAAAALLTLRFALSFADALLLSLTFSVGGFTAFLIIKEISKRSSIETIPYGLRGTPVFLVSMGILSLVFSAVSVLLLKSFL